MLRLNQVSSIRHAVLAGMGISILPDYVVKGDIAADNLVEIPLALNLPQRDVFAVYSATQGAPRKVRVFIDYLLEFFAARESQTLANGVAVSVANDAGNIALGDTSSQQFNQGSGGELFRSQSVA